MSDPQNITINGKEIDDNKDNNTNLQDDISTTKHDDCNHIWIVCSHPTIPYSGLFCEKCHVEKRN